MMSDNRAILLTPPGASAIAVIRLIGPRVADFLRDHFSIAEPAPNRCVHGKLRDGDRELDDPVVVFSPDGPRADLNLHGGAWVVSSVLELARRAGFVIESGDRNPEAIDAAEEIERDVLAHLPLARTELAIRALLAQPAAWAALRGRKLSDAEIRRIESDRALIHLLHPPRVAIAGAPNVGKSTLANQLFAQARSIVADVPGTTRDWVGEIANIDGLAVLLMDTPGVRATDDPIEHEAISRSREEMKAHDLIVLVLDATRPIDPEQRPLLEAHARAMRVINKSDQRSAWDTSSFQAVRTVATTGDGIDELRHAILRQFGCDNFDPGLARRWSDSVAFTTVARCPGR